MLGCKAEDEPDPRDLRGLRFPVSIGRYEPCDATEGHTAARLRNAAIRQARGERIVFTDSDCLVAPECLARHSRAGGRTALCGARCDLPISAQSAGGELADYAAVRRRSNPDWRTVESNDVPGRRAYQWENFWTCNSSAPRQMVVEAGMFDESGFRCHDLDLAYRLDRLRATFVFDPQCEIIHVDHPRSLWFRRAQAAGIALLAKKHPQLAPFAEDLLPFYGRAFRRTLHECEARFRDVCSGLPGFRSRLAWVMPAGCELAAVRKALAGIPAVIRDGPDGDEVFLGLHGDCWDYSVIVPRSETIRSPRFSICLCVGGCEQPDIRRALDSIFTQTTQSFEVLVLADGPDTASHLEVLPYCRSGRVRFLSHESGQRTPLERISSAYRGQYLVQLDEDEWLEESALAQLESTFALNPDVSVVYSTPTVFDAGCRHKGEAYHVRSGADRQGHVPRYVGAYRIARCVQEHGGGAFEFPMDDGLALARIAEGQSVLHLPSRLYSTSAGPVSSRYGKPRTYLTSGLAAAKNDDQQVGSWSVIIPVGQSSAYQLELAVRSWLQSDLMGRDWELVLVGNVPDCGSLRSLIDLESRIRVIGAPGLGQAAAKNVGSRAAGLETLFFSDPSCIVPPGVIGQHERALSRQRESIGIGCVFGRSCFTVISSRLPRRLKAQVLDLLRNDSRFDNVAQSLLGPDAAAHLVEASSLSIWKDAGLTSVEGPLASVWGEALARHGNTLAGYADRWLKVDPGSLSIRKSVFDALGGFDEELPGLEGWDFGLRMQLRGSALVCLPGAEPYRQVPASSQPVADTMSVLTRFETKHPGAFEGAKNNPHSAQSAIVIRRGLRRSLNAGKKPAQPTTKSVFCPTFDDGPHPCFTDQVLDLLATIGWKATFFVLGSCVRRYPEAARRIAAEGHELGLHGLFHEDLTKCTYREISGAIRNSRQLVEDCMGVKMRWFRPPFGRCSALIRETCEEEGLSLARWDVSSKDWTGHGFRDSVSAVAARGLIGKVLLFHDGSGDPPETLKAIEVLGRISRSLHFRGVTLSDAAERLAIPSICRDDPFQRHARPRSVAGNT